MTKRRDRSNESIFDRGYGTDARPDFEIRGDADEIVGVGWSRPEGAQRPERYDHSYPDKRHLGYRVYLLYLSLLFIFLCIPSWCVARLFVEMVV